MKRLSSEPALLPNVMEAIARMKERTGSTQKQIIGHISQQLTSTNTSRNMAMKVHRALQYALRSGLIKRMPGKYILSLNNRDLAISRKFTDPNDCNVSRRRGRRRNRRKNRSRRRRNKKRSHYLNRRRPSNENSVIENTETNRDMTATLEPLDESRRRGKRRTRRYRKERSSLTIDEANSRTSEVDCKNSKTAFLPEKKCLEQEKPEYQSKDGGNEGERNNQESIQNQDDKGHCGNPHCLCSIKQEDGSKMHVQGE